VAKLVYDDEEEAEALFEELLARLAENIRLIRKRQNLSQHDAATLCPGMAQPRIQEIESERQNLTLRTLARLAIGLEVDPVKLLAKPRERKKRRAKKTASGKSRT
jgi:transcriptional regulator with XRE-family HTH domain